MKKEVVILSLLLVLVPTVFADHLTNADLETLEVQNEDPAHLELHHLLYQSNLAYVQDLSEIDQSLVVDAINQKYGIIVSPLASPSRIEAEDTTLFRVDFTIRDSNSAFVFNNPAALDEFEELLQIEGNAGDKFTVEFEPTRLIVTLEGAKAFIGSDEGFVMSAERFDSVAPGQFTLTLLDGTQTVNGENIVYEDEEGITQGDVSLQRGAPTEPVQELPEATEEPQEPTEEPPIVEDPPAPEPTPEPVPIVQPVEREDKEITPEEFVIETLQLELEFKEIPQTLIDERTERLQNTLEHVEIQREIIRTEDRTRVVLTIKPDEGFFKRTLAENYTLYERIPKCFGTLSEIVFEEEPTEIIDPDPAYKNTFGDVKTEQKFEYYVNSKVKDECDKFFQVIGISENVRKLGLTDTIAAKGLVSALWEFKWELLLFSALFLGLIIISRIVSIAKKAAE
jgi:hypothetical protein